MSNVSIFGRGWTDLVFEGRNKEYGAYQLRRQNSRTTIFALCTALLLLLLLSFLPRLFSLSGEVTQPAIAETPTLVELSDYDPPTPPKADPPQPHTTTAAAPPALNNNLANMQPVAAPLATDPVPLNTDVSASPGSPDGTSTTPSTAATGTGTDTPSGNGNATAVENTPYLPAMLDRKPEYPGGIKNFYAYIGRNFETPEESGSASGNIKVLVSFVVERDGSMTDIRVLQNPGFGVDKEAIRVLKSMKVKWAPGIYKGQKVRTSYTLPIMVEKP